MTPASRPWWQQATALVSLGAGGAITGFSFVPRTAADLTSPSAMPVGLMALQESARPAQPDSAALRSAIVNVANYYLRMAGHKTAAEMEAIIWQRDSIDGADHGASCAAFASLTLELGAHVVGRHSWVSGGSTYPWPLHRWADVRVDANPASPGVTSIVQDAQTHDRWRPMGDGYQPQPGDWVLFDGHVEVVTKYSGGVLSTIGGDSLPDFSVNAHEYGDPLSAQGVVGFVDNGDLPGAVSAAGAALASAGGAAGADQPESTPMAIPGVLAAAASTRGQARLHGGAAIPGASVPAHGPGKAGQPARSQAQRQPSRAGHSGLPRDPARAAAPAAAGVPGAYMSGPAAWPRGATADTAVIPGLPMIAHRLSGRPAARPAEPYLRHQPPTAGPVNDTGAQQAFISAVAPGAIAAQRTYGVPASVTIAQAIDESGWGHSNLAVRDHNLFGIKGVGPAGSDVQPTQEYENGQLVTSTSQFRVYQTAAQSIDDHGRLLATSGYYRTAMAERGNPNAFATSLTGVYATDPGYGTKLISLMRQYDLYRYDSVASASAHHAASPATPVARTPTPPPATPAPAPEPASPTPAPATATPARSPAAAQAAPGPATPAQPAATPAGGTPSPPAAQPAPGPATAGTPASGGAAPGPATPRTAAAAAARGSASIPGVPGTGPGRSPRAAAAATRKAAPASRSAPTTARAPTTGRAPTTARPPITARAPITGSAPTTGSATTARTPAPAPSRRSAAELAQSGPAPSTQAVSAKRIAAPASPRSRRPASRQTRTQAMRYLPQIPAPVKNAYLTAAREPLLRAEPLYRDVADHNGISWELLAACDWMQCQARARYSPVHGEKLGSENADGTSYRTKSEALEQCADELVLLAGAVYQIDLAAPGYLSVRALANVFAAFRWGGLLRLHRTSAMEFPYSVAGLTEQHMKMRWPNIDDPNAPDRPGARFRMPFGAVPVVLSLNYPATA